MENSNIHIGNLILEKLAEQERSISWLADKINLHRCHLPRVLKKTSIDSEVLYRISAELNTDFHATYSKKLVEKTVGSAINCAPLHTF